MTYEGLRVGPFEITQAAEVPEPGLWFRGQRTGMTRKQPSDVLVRVLEPDASEADRAGLKRQFEALRAIEDPRVPSAIAFYEGVGAMALSFARGTPLAALLEARRDNTVLMTPATLLDVILELAETLQRVHHRNRVHGQLSARQILLGADGKLWIFGFGVPKRAEEDIRWTPPELARGEPATASTDQWALGALAAALITGHPPWRGDAAAEALQGSPDPIVEPVERQWPALGRMLRRMLDPHPSNRFPSMHPVRQEFLALARKAGGTSDRKELGQLLTARSENPHEAVPVSFVADTDIDEFDAPDAPTVPIDEIERPPMPSEVPTLVLEEPPEPVVDPGEALPLPKVPTAEIPMARTAAAAVEEPRRSDPLPSEQIPVVRPDLVGEVPDAGLSGDAAILATFENMSPDVEPSEATLLYSDVVKAEDATIEHAPIPESDPAITNPGEDEPSTSGEAEEPSSEQDEEDDQQATVRMKQEDVAKLAERAEPVELQVEFTDEHESADTAVPLSDPDVASDAEEVPQAGAPSMGADWFQKTDAGADDDSEEDEEEPSTEASAPRLVADEEPSRLTPVPLGAPKHKLAEPPPTSNTPQMVAMALSAAFALLFVVWLLTRLI